MPIRQRTKIVRDAAEAPRIVQSLGATPQNVIIALPSGSVKPRSPAVRTPPPEHRRPTQHPCPPTPSSKLAASGTRRRFLAGPEMPATRTTAIGFQRGQALADRRPLAWQNRGRSGIIRFGGSKSRLPELRLDHVQRLWVTQVEPTTILKRKEVIHRHGGQDTHMLRLRGQFHLHRERTGDVRIQGLHQ